MDGKNSCRSLSITFQSGLKNLKILLLKTGYSKHEPLVLEYLPPRKLLNGELPVPDSGLQALTGITGRKDHIRESITLNLIYLLGKMVTVMTGHLYGWKRCVRVCRIIQQCINNMPAGHYKSDHPLAIPPRKDKTMTDIETLITHFVGVSWGPVIPAGEAMVPVEGAKG